jgi:hypothetical protein
MRTFLSLRFILTKVSRKVNSRQASENSKPTEGCRVFLFTSRSIEIEEIKVRKLVNGDEVLFDNGDKRTVRAMPFGDGLIAFDGRAAREILIEFSDGTALRAHPGQSI